ncbi:MAG: leucine-rich repeat domain-containing protein [Clostridia bacterium]|nr:leucine-rich repeat domain-containing protein [Clostridia bacterium]
MKPKPFPLIPILLFMAALFACAAASSAFTCGDYRYTLAGDGSAVIEKYTGKDVMVRIPAEIDGHPVSGIGSRAFYGCDSFHSVIFPSTADFTFIGDLAFARCKSLTSLDIPANVTVIGREAFRDCRMLSDVTLREGLEEIGDRTFSGCVNLCGAKLPDSVVRVGVNPWTGCLRITWAYVSPRNPALASVDGVLYSKADKRLICYPSAHRGASFSIPRGVRIIGDEAFIFASFPTEVTVPDTVTQIGNRAFCGCGCLVSAVLPGSVAAIGDDAFADCPVLMLTVSKDSAAEKYCAAGGIPFVYREQ